MALFNLSLAYYFICRVLHILIAKEENSKAISIAKKMAPSGLDILNALGQV